MHIKYLAATVALASTAWAGAAFAQSGSTTTTTDWISPGNGSGPYVGVGWGRFNLKVDDLSDVESGVSDITHGHGDAWKINAGYRFMPYFALEADYIDFGHPGGSFSGSGSDGNYKLHVSGFAPFAVGTIPLGPVELFGKAGWLWSNNKLELNLNSPGQQVIQSSHSTSNFIYGAGLGITFFQHLNANLEWDRVKVENANNSDALWLAAQWRF